MIEMKLVLGVTFQVFKRTPSHRRLLLKNRLSLCMSSGASYKRKGPLLADSLNIESTRRNIMVV